MPAPEEIIAFSPDLDSSVFTLGQSIEEILAAPHNQRLFQQMVDAAVSNKQVVLLIGSNRQDAETDRKNSNKRRGTSPSAVAFIEALATHLKEKIPEHADNISINRIMAADLSHGHPNGTHWERLKERLVGQQIPEDADIKALETCIKDESKISTIIAQAHELAIRAKGRPVTLHFTDDRPDILNGLGDYFYNFPDMLPANVRLSLALHQNQNLIDEHANRLREAESTKATLEERLKGLSLPFPITADNRDAVAYKLKLQQKESELQSGKIASQRQLISEATDEKSLLHSRLSQYQEQLTQMMADLKKVSSDLDGLGRFSEEDFNTLKAHFDLSAGLENTTKSIDQLKKEIEFDACERQGAGPVVSETDELFLISNYLATHAAKGMPLPDPIDVLKMTDDTMREFCKREEAGGLDAASTAIQGHTSPEVISAVRKIVPLLKERNKLVFIDRLKLRFNERAADTREYTQKFGGVFAKAMDGQERARSRTNELQILQKFIDYLEGRPVLGFTTRERAGLQKLPYFKALQSDEQFKTLLSDEFLRTSTSDDLYEVQEGQMQRVRSSDAEAGCPPNDATKRLKMMVESYYRVTFKAYDITKTKNDPQSQRQLDLASKLRDHLSSIEVYQSDPTKQNAPETLILTKEEKKLGGLLGDLSKKVESHSTGFIKEIWVEVDYDAGMDIKTLN